MLSRRELIAGERQRNFHWQMDFIMSVLVLKLELKDDEIGIAYDR